MNFHFFPLILQRKQVPYIMYKDSTISKTSNITAFIEPILQRMSYRSVKNGMKTIWHMDALFPNLQKEMSLG